MAEISYEEYRKLYPNSPTREDYNDFIRADRRALEDVKPGLLSSIASLPGNIFGQEDVEPFIPQGPSKEALSIKSPVEQIRSQNIKTLVDRGFSPKYAEQVMDTSPDNVLNIQRQKFIEQGILADVPENIQAAEAIGTSGPSIESLRPSVRGIFEDLGVGKNVAGTGAETAGMDLAGIESMAGLLGKVMMMRGLLDNSSQNPMAAAPRGAPGLNLQRQDLYKRYRG